MTEFDELRAWSRSLLVGEKVRLRAIQPEDLATLAQWWNEPDVALFQQERIAQQPLPAIQELISSWSENKNTSGVGYTVTTLDGAIAGHIALYGITPPVMIGTLGVMMGPQHQDSGMGREAIILMLRLAFLEMAAKKIELKVFSYNERAVRVYQKLGFSLEGRRRNAVFHRGTFYDELTMGILDAEYLEKYGRPD